jgi:site-specific recombinase XerD
VTDEPHALIPAPHRDLLSLTLAPQMPQSVANAGPGGAFAWDEFFAAHCRNRHTRLAYGLAVRKFLAWVEPSGVALARVTPGMVGAYFAQHAGATATRKLDLAALRAFFDIMVNRHVCVLNPAASVRGERYKVIEGKTPQIMAPQARALLASIDLTTVVGLRDRAVVAVLIYTAARAGAVAKLRVGSFGRDGNQWALRFEEKGGKSRSIPVRHDLERYILEYLAAAVIDPTVDRDRPLFRSAAGRTGLLTPVGGLSNVDVCRIIKRKLATAGLPTHLSPHSFRVATVTDLLTQGVPMEDVAYLAGHADPRTTRLYDRRKKSVTRNVVERISI